jgi:hypothetical protein
VLAVQGLDPEVEEPRDGGSCHTQGGDIVAPRLHERVKLTTATRLRSHLGRDLARDPKLARGARVYVHALAQDGAWIICASSVRARARSDRSSWSWPKMAVGLGS